MEKEGTQSFPAVSLPNSSKITLRECFNELDGKKAVGEDGVDKERYRENLDDNLRELIVRMKRMGYRSGPVRQVLISKGRKTKREETPEK